MAAGEAIEVPSGVALADTVTALGAAHRGKVLVAGSHGGVVAAHYALAAHVRAAIFNDAGIGLDEAGVAGLDWLERYGVAAAALAHTSARIADARQAWLHGTVSRANAGASALGIAGGMACREAAERLVAAALVEIDPESYAEGRYRLSGSPEVWGLDSVGQVRPEDDGRILVIGSHCELHGGVPESALQVTALAAFFHDAGLGSLADACTRLPELARRGVPAAAVDYRSARIGDARSLWKTGVLSAINAPGRLAGWVTGMRVSAAARRFAEATRAC